MSGLMGPWLSNVDPADERPEPLQCDWCSGDLPEWETGLFCSETCRRAARSDVMDFNPEPVRNE